MHQAGSLVLWFPDSIPGTAFGIAFLERTGSGAQDTVGGAILASAKRYATGLDLCAQRYDLRPSGRCPGQTKADPFRLSDCIT